MSGQSSFNSRRRSALPDGARLGTVELGCFRLKEVLGRGSYGTVFLAEQEGFARDAVVKIAHAKLVEGRNGDMVRSRFAAELRAATQVNHPNVVTLFTAGETADGLPAIAMEYVPGAPLEDILEQRAGDLPDAFIHDVFAQLGSAVAAFHQASVTHRDLSPGNVVVGDSENGVSVKVLDFGVAKLGGDRGRSSVVGTPRYMAPEQVVGSAGPASDVYAVGAMLWWAISGEEFQSQVRTLEDVTEARLMGAKPRDIRTLAPRTPNDVADILNAMLSFEASDRPTAAEFCERWAACEPDPQASSSRRRSVTIPGFQEERPVQTVHDDLLQCIVFDTDRVRVGVLDGFLSQQRCRTRAIPVHEATEALSMGPQVVFVSGGLMGGASISLLERARRDTPGALIVALIDSERQRTAMIRAGADYALRVPTDLVHLVEHLEEARQSRNRALRATIPGVIPPAAHVQPSQAMVEEFLGEAPELLADIGDALDLKQAVVARRACDRLRTRATELGGTELAQLCAACSAFVAEGDFEKAAGFRDQLELGYATVFRQLMTLHSEHARQLETR